ncbi:hypothetical protein NEF87_000241 [Candidatus Lokiarchaeum ossiferum]|uniref:Transposase n=1 Tax=Candidatus Lokiarchaeum ossiferum TaxID=2951803 RepID=A0ABY6HKM0_9ARCH|nr:hypothetical protein NEF87_000241 [Candidatus Lokiarchaeum sp. B-35]
MAQEKWIIEETKRYDQELRDQKEENRTMRKIVNRSLLKSKKNSKAYRG